MRFANNSFIKTLLAVIFLDQISKFLAGRESSVLLNEGVSFGLFTLLPSAALTVLLFLMIAAVWYPYRFAWKRQPIASGLFFGGGIANLLDRMYLGGVRDWLPVPFLNLHNNIADYAIAIGLIWLLIFGLRKSYYHSLEDETVNRSAKPSREAALSKDEIIETSQNQE